MNKKGTTLIEIIVSIVLISIVLVLLLNLFLLVRTTYNQSKMEAEYDLLVSNIVDAVTDDINKYDLESIQEIKKEGESNNHSAYLLTFNTYRPTKLSNKIQKVLEVTSEARGGKLRYYISYFYNDKYSDPNSEIPYSITKDIVSKERITNIVRGVPEDAILDSTRYIHIIEMEDGDSSRLGKKAVEIKIPIFNQSGTKYDINIYSFINGRIIKYERSEV